MSKGLSDIISEGMRHRACDKIKEIGSLGEAITMLLSPQGREFAMHTGFPALATFRDNASALSAIPGVFVDSGRSLASNMDCVAVGDTSLAVSFRNPKKLYHVMSMHGAHVTIDAREHAVITATVIDGYIDIKGDGTAAITVERKHG